MDYGSLNHLFVMTSHLHFRSTICRFIEHGVGEGQPKILFTLRDEDGVSQAELARQCHLEPATVTATLGRMEKAALIERRADKQDLRVTRVFLTDAGRELTTTLDRLNEEIGAECFAGFSDEERQQMAQFYDRMRDNMERARAAKREGDK